MKNRYSILLIITSFALTLCASVPETWTILGGNRGVGYALAEELSSNPSYHCRVVVRDGEKTKKLFSQEHAPTIIQADACGNAENVINACAGSTYIVIAQTFPYDIWEKSLNALVNNAKAAARVHNATLIYYGRIYPYGLTKVITETSPTAPQTTTSHQARVLDAIETTLKEDDSIKTIIIRHSTPFGKNIGDGLLEKNFSNIVKNESLSWYQSLNAFEWIGASEEAARTLATQMTFTADLARFTCDYVTSNDAQQEGTRIINFAGINTTIDAFAQTYCTLAHSPCEFNIYTRSALQFATVLTRKRRVR